MKKETTPVYLASDILLPGKQKPEIKDLFEKTEQSKEERVHSLSKQLASLNMIKMNGFTEEINTENFPDVPDHHLEDARFVSDTNMSKYLHRNAAEAQDPELKKIFQNQATNIEKERDKRAKLFFMKKHEEIAIEPEPTKPTLLQQKHNDPLANTGQYL